MNRASWLRAINEIAAGLGAAVDSTRGDHIVVRHPSGWFVYCASTPGDRRALQNVRGDLRRKAAGVWR